MNIAATRYYHPNFEFQTAARSEFWSIRKKTKEGESKTPTGYNVRGVDMDRFRAKHKAVEDLPVEI